MSSNLIRSFLVQVKKHVRRWWRGEPAPTSEEVMPYIFEKEMYELIEAGRKPDCSMELLDSYVGFRNEGNDAAEAKQLALREWDM